MATKAELETELIKLRRELAESHKPSRENTADEVRKEPDEALSQAEGSADGENDIPTSKEEVAGIIESLKGGDFEGVVQQLMDELDGMPNRKPILTALGAFIVGYLVGRSGSKG
jgi:hypothetical protein